VAPGRDRSEERPDDELVARVRDGETRLFEELVRRYQDPVYGMALRFLGDSAEAQDVAQEAFLRAFRGIKDFKGEARFSTWLYRITYNLCADWLRRNRKPGRRAAPYAEAEEVADAHEDLEGGLLEREEREAVRRAVDELDGIYRTVVILLYYQKLSYEQIAAVLGVPVKTVETRLYRARRLLREALSGEAARGGVA
jgi:RNA polymerase sigma-70 factor, ECF subfamily